MTRLAVTHNRIEKYWQIHKHIPASANQLPAHVDGDRALTDGWGRELKWESDGKSKVRVWSLGRDGIEEGTGEDADTEMVFDESAQQEAP